MSHAFFYSVYYVPLAMQEAGTICTFMLTSVRGEGKPLEDGGKYLTGEGELFLRSSGHVTFPAWGTKKGTEYRSKEMLFLWWTMPKS